MSTATIKSGVVISAKFVKEEHNQYGILYHHEVVIGNDAGIYRSKKKVQQNFVVGEEADYSVAYNEKLKCNLISPYREERERRNMEAKKYNTEEDIKTSANWTAIDAALDFAINKKITDKKAMSEALNNFSEWLHTKNLDTEMKHRQAALKRGIKAMNVEVLEIDTLEKVTATSDKYLKYAVVRPKEQSEAKS